MKALILAAGYGKRLRPITDSIPKSMVKVGGTPLLVNALNNLTGLGIKDIGIVVGHMADYIRTAIGNNYNGAKVTYYENPRYMETNNIYSLYKALDFFGGKDGFENRIRLDEKKRKLALEHNISVLDWKYNVPIRDDTVKLFLEENNIATSVCFGQKAASYMDRSYLLYEMAPPLS